MWVIQLSRHLHQRFVVLRKGSLCTIKSALIAPYVIDPALEDNSRFYASTFSSTGGIIIDGWPDPEKFVGGVLIDG